MPSKWDNPTPEMQRAFEEAAAHVPNNPMRAPVTIQRQIASANLMHERRNAEARAARETRRRIQEAADEANRLDADVRQAQEAAYAFQRVSGPAIPNQHPQVWEPILQRYRPLRPGEPYPEHQTLNTPGMGQNHATTTQLQVDYTSVHMKPEDQAALINFISEPGNSSASRSGSSGERRSNMHDKANKKQRHH